MIEWWRRAYAEERCIPVKLYVALPSVSAVSFQGIVGLRWYGGDSTAADGGGGVCLCCYYCYWLPSTLLLFPSCVHLIPLHYTGTLTLRMASSLQTRGEWKER